MKQLCYCLFFWVQMSVIQAQIPYQVITSDIDHYWEAYDSIVATHDYAQKVALMNRLYIDRGSAGLHAFMKARDYSDTLFVNHILKYPKFWQSIRGKTLSIKNQTPLIAASLKRLKKLYPALRPAIMYFTIGGLRSGGTTDKDMVLIGSEILVGDSQTVVSEFTDEWLKSIFEAKETPDIVYLNTHEYIHTQQKDGFVNVLSQAIKEGSCDFIAELVLQQPIKTVYTDYGDAHFEAVKAAFKQDMFSDRTHWWLYNGRSILN